MKHMVVLDCPSCAAELEIHHDVKTLACGQCGARLIVIRRGGTVSLSTVGTGHGTAASAERVAAELALVRLEKELADAVAWVESLENSQGRFNPQHVMTDAAVAQAQRQAADLRDQLEQKDNPNSVIISFTVLLVAVGGIFTFTRQGAWNIFVTLVMILVGGAVFWFIVVALMVYTHTDRESRRQSHLRSLELQLRLHEAAVEHQLRSSYLPTARASVERLKDELSQKRRIVSS